MLPHHDTEGPVRELEPIISMDGFHLTQVDET